MKKLLFTLTGFLFLSFVAKAQTLNENNIGEFHNAQMEKYYEMMKNSVADNGAEKFTKEESVKIFKDLTTGVFGDKNEAVKNYTDTSFEEYLDYTLEKSINTSLDRVKNSTFGSAEFKTYLQNLIKGSVDLDETNYKTYFNSKKEEAVSKFKDEELQIALSGINTGLASFKYWNDNFEKWSNLNPKNTSSVARGGGRRVGSADVGGAVAGGIWGAVGGTMFLPGVGTVAGAAGCAVAGGLYASTAAAAAAAWDALW